MLLSELCQPESISVVPGVPRGSRPRFVPVGRLDRSDEHRRNGVGVDLDVKQRRFVAVDGGLDGDVGVVVPTQPRAVQVDVDHVGVLVHQRSADGAEVAEPGAEPDHEIGGLQGVVGDLAESPAAGDTEGVRLGLGNGTLAVDRGATGVFVAGANAVRASAAPVRTTPSPVRMTGYSAVWRCSRTAAALSGFGAGRSRG